MNFGIPQTLLLAYLVFTTGVHAALHGKPRVSKFHVGSALTSDAIVLAVLYWGGFFN
jgi:hypothetical protein